jgi:sugar lactone lactonase YvrE
MAMARGWQSFPGRWLGLLLASSILSFTPAIAGDAHWEPGRCFPGETASLDESRAAALRHPESATAVRRWLAAAHQAGDSEQVRAALGRLADMGFGLSAATQAMLSVHLSVREADAFRARFDSNRARLGTSRLVDAVPAGIPLIEGIARDPRTGRLFATSVVGRALLVRDEAGWREVRGLDPGSLFGMAIDVEGRRLWIASGALDQTPSPATAFRGLIGVDLDSLHVVKRLKVPDGGSPGDVGFGADRVLYASDPVLGTVYRAKPDDGALSVLVPPGVFGNPQGLATSRNGRLLYVADYSCGIAVIDIGSGNIARLTARGPMMLDGVDGLVRQGDGLILVQNGINPSRIARLTLGGGGRRVDRLEIIERANPEWGEPTLAALDGGELLYVADAQWERYGPAGRILGEGATRPTPIRALVFPRKGARTVSDRVAGNRARAAKPIAGRRKRGSPQGPETG